MASVSLILSLDTEEDNWAPTRTGWTVENARSLPQWHVFCRRVGVYPSYLVTYSMASTPWAAAILRDLASDGTTEIGAHLHPWNTPPSEEPEPRHFTMLRHYPLASQIAKLESLRESVFGITGTVPTVFRAGRFGLGRDTVTALVRCGFDVDTSVTPHFSWADYDAGPDFIGAPMHAYRVDGIEDLRRHAPGGSIIEVPLSSGHTRFAPRTWRRLGRIFGHPVSRAMRLASVSARVGLTRRCILSPEVHAVEDMVSLSRVIVQAGIPHLHMFLHSSTLRAGLSPFGRTQSDVHRIYDRIERYLDIMRAEVDLVPSTVAQVAARYARA
jgi:hypothetical protein